MAIVCIHDLDSSGQQTYDKAMANVDVSHPPEGHLLHAAGPTASGWRIVEVWETEEHMHRFQAERLIPAFEAAGVQPPEPRIEVFPARVLIVGGEPR